MKRFFSKYRIITIIVCILLSVVMCAVVSRLTDGFENFDPTEIFAKDLNEENLLFETYDDFEDIDEKSYSVTLKNGAFTIDGTVDGDEGEVVEIEFATITLKPGTYTYTCFEDPDFEAYLSYCEYSSGGSTVTVIADDADEKVSLDQSAFTEHQTFTVNEDTECKFVIRLLAGEEYDNVIARPCLVEGEKAGNFYE